MKFLHELIDYLHGDKPYAVRSYLMTQYSKTTDNNKGKFWEEVLEKAMPHTRLLEGNAWGRDFDDDSDAKFATYYHKENGLGSFEASVSNIRTKIGYLRICLCVPGENYHKLHFLLIPKEAYEPYLKGSNALKFGLSPKGKPTGKLAKYLCSFEEVCQPLVDNILK